MRNSNHNYSALKALTQLNAERWDQVGGLYPCTFPIDIQLIEDHVRPTMRVLDYGCGAGRVGLLVRSLFPDVHLTGMDSSKKMCDLAKICKAYNVIDFVDNPFAPKFRGQFDIILILGVLSSILPRALRASIVGQVLATLSLGGKVVLGDFDGTIEYNTRYCRLFQEKKVFPTSAGFWIKHLSAPDLRELIGGDFEAELSYYVSALSLTGNLVLANTLVARRVK